MCSPVLSLLSFDCFVFTMHVILFCSGCGFQWLCIHVSIPVVQSLNPTLMIQSCIVLLFLCILWFLMVNVICCSWGYGGYGRFVCYSSLFFSPSAHTKDFLNISFMVFFWSLSLDHLVLCLEFTEHVLRKFCVFTIGWDIESRKMSGPHGV